MLRIATSFVLIAAVSVGCGADSSGVFSPTTSETSPVSTPSTSKPTRPTRTRPTPVEVPDEGGPRNQATPINGIDASHHQGSIDWQRVARDDVSFAYLKATEGTGFVDDQFLTNSSGARAAGLRAGGYHYFSLCSDGADQGRHFASVLDQAGGLSLPPAVDLELLGHSCALPTYDGVLAQVRAFIDVVEQETGREVVVYEFPEFAERYDLGAELDRRLWVRRLGDTPPKGDWWLWQRSQTGSVDGISGGVDLNVLRTD